MNEEHALPFPPPNAASGQVSLPLPRVILLDEPVALNASRNPVILHVENTGDRPIQVGSHYHFFEVNRALHFDRAAARGRRLNIPAGTAVRFEPGDTCDVEVLAYGGEQRVIGFSGAIEPGLAPAVTPPPERTGEGHAD